MKASKTTPSFKRPTWAKGHEWASWEFTKACAWKRCNACKAIVQVDKAAMFQVTVMYDNGDCGTFRLLSAESARKFAELYLELWQ